MDRFITRKPREKQVTAAKSTKKHYKQCMIESLKGVVVIEDIRRLQAKLRSSGTPKEEMVECLVELGKKIPPRNVMKETKIGKDVNKLRNHEDETVKKAAKRVYIGWKTHFEGFQDKPQIEVKCDTKTEKLRSSGQKLLADALGVQNEDQNLPEVIERETFHYFKRLVNNSYRRTIRNLVFTLKNQEVIRNQVLTGEMSVKTLIETYKR